MNEAMLKLQEKLRGLNLSIGVVVSDRKHDLWDKAKKLLGDK